jgi:hypothetical protein
MENGIYSFQRGSHEIRVANIPGTRVASGRQRIGEARIQHANRVFGGEGCDDGPPQQAIASGEKKMQRHGFVFILCRDLRCMETPQALLLLYRNLAGPQSQKADFEGGNAQKREIRLSP